MFTIGKLILYSTITCANCEVVKKKFDSEGIEYEINQDISEMRNLGIRSVPVVKWNGELLFFNDIMSRIDEFKESNYFVKKRNGDIVKFDINRILSAIRKAMNDTVNGIDENLALNISNLVKNHMFNSIDTPTVEQIQDMVEMKLMDSDRKDVAKQYILYRNNRRITRNTSENKTAVESKYKLLDDEFISKYKHMTPPMTQLGTFVFYRTYSRWLPKEKRREYWWETCRRSIEYNCSLVDGVTKEEAQELFDNQFHLRQFLAGRTLYTGMSASAYSNPASQFNCSFLVIDDFSSYKDICYLLMLGCGVGYSVEDKYISMLPKVRGDVKLIHQEYKELPKHKRKEVTDFTIVNNTMEMNVGDSKNGWASAIDYFLKVFYDADFKSVNNIIINYDSVRPFGERLKTFGGKSSGYDALLKIIDKTYRILIKNNKSYKKLTSVDAMDISTCIAEGIVVGGIRRSAQMCLFDSTDEEMMSAKNNLYIMDENGVWSANQEIIHRMMSNNSVAYYNKPSLEELKKRFETIKYSAEGNFFNMEAAVKRNPHSKGTNPCGEILLDSKEFCNLTTINALGFVKNKVLDKEGLLNAQRLSARAGYRMASIEVELPQWNKNLVRDRLIGCSLTGWQDMINETNMPKEEEIKLIKQMREIAIQAGKEYAEELRMNEPLLTTALKPEGTISLMPTVSSGLHFSHSEYYIRRVRINASDPLVKVCEELGYPIYPEVGQEMETCKIKVIEFPVKSPKGRTKYDVSAIEQLEIYKMFMENYVTHNASNTISVKPDEWDGVVQWIYDNWDSVIGVTFISLDNTFYKLLPYESIDKEEYDRRASEMKPFLPSLLSKYEVEELELDIGDEKCDSGSCPVR
jgi:adenosylcobalamin-dependent ribonucleoside-triphosphate reductase